jgi:hypothetical protein
VCILWEFETKNDSKILHGIIQISEDLSICFFSLIPKESN